MGLSCPVRSAPWRPRPSQRPQPYWFYLTTQVPRTGLYLSYKNSDKNATESRTLESGAPQDVIFIPTTPNSPSASVPVLSKITTSLS